MLFSALVLFFFGLVLLLAPAPAREGGGQSHSALPRRSHKKAPQPRAAKTGRLEVHSPWGANGRIMGPQSRKPNSLAGG